MNGNSSQTQAVGIDLGTTFSTIAIVDQNGQSQAIPNAEGKFSTPSVAIWHNDAFIVGQPALDLVKSATQSEREQVTSSLVRGVKRMLGRPPTGGLLSGGHRTTPVEVSAAILAKLARDASAYLGFPVSKAVITVPAHFDDAERNTTKTAAEMAGLHVLQMMNEPSAAALHYSHGKTVHNGTILVFDLGGGTFDATILHIDSTGSRVLATQGIEELGGINFTNKLAGELQRRYEAQNQQKYPQDHISSDVLVVEAERVKCLLSSEQEAVAHLAPLNGIPTDIPVTSQQLTRMLRLFMTQLQTAVEIALEHAKKEPADIDRVLLCGGSSRIPAVQAMLQETFARAPEHTLDLDLSVALGAAYQASSYEPGLQLMPGGLIIDCVSYPVGIAVLNAQGNRQVKLVMLQTGDQLDSWSQSFGVRLANTSRDFPPIAVYRGEGSELDPADYLGEIRVALPAGINSGTRALIRMQQDQSGLIQIQIVINEQILPGELHRVQH